MHGSCRFYTASYLSVAISLSAFSLWYGNKLMGSCYILMEVSDAVQKIGAFEPVNIFEPIACFQKRNYKTAPDVKKDQPGNWLIFGDVKDKLIVEFITLNDWAPWKTPNTFSVLFCSHLPSATLFYDYEVPA